MLGFTHANLLVGVVSESLDGVLCAGQEAGQLEQQADDLVHVLDVRAVLVPLLLRAALALNTTQHLQAVTSTAMYNTTTARDNTSTARDNTTTAMYNTSTARYNTTTARDKTTTARDNTTA